MNGEPPEPLADSTTMRGWLCVRSLGKGVEPPDRRCIEWHGLHPIYAEEAAYVSQFEDADELLEWFRERDVPTYIDAQRQNVFGLGSSR